jgi:solute carrier family 6 amino acid transporter-like protein 5/7/9/14
MDTFTSLLAGFTIFSVLGNLSYESGIPIEDVLDGGNGLAFISYPMAIANFPWAPQLFAVLFFLMLFTLGIGSATADAGAIITIFVDQFPNIQRWKITTLLCLTAFLFGLIYVTPGGQFILNMVDFYGASFVIFITSTLEVIGVIWFYGIDNFINDIQFMLDIRIGWYWRICWGYVIPVGLTAILIYSFAADYEPLTYKDTGYPTIATVFGWLMAATALSAVPISAFLAVRKSTKSTLMEKIIDSTKPTEAWGPRDPKIRLEWNQFRKRKLEERIGKLQTKCVHLDNLMGRT